MEIEDKLKGLPVTPGVYIMRGKDGVALYIGKAKSLRSRVRSYFRETGDGRYAVKFLARMVADIDCIVTTNEKEALLLEDTLIKQHRPKYNISLKDSKTYVSIKITTAEKYPRILVTRQVKKDGSRYFGPYPSARAVRETVKFIRRLFPLCVCSSSVFRNRVRPCLDYQLHLCSAPAVGLVTEEAYKELVDGAIMFLEGRNKELVKALKGRMNEAATSLDFEKAAEFRDRISAIDEMLEEQKVVTHRATDQDVFAFIRSDDAIIMQTLVVRSGRLVGSQDFFFKDTGLPDDEVLSSFVTQFYRGDKYLPDEVIIPLALEDSEVIGEWLSEKKGRKVALSVPERGDKLKLLKMASSNASEALKRRLESRRAKEDLLDELKARLHLLRPPRRIEAFDISNIGSDKAVGAMVTFKDGAPDKGAYRLFRIKDIEGPDDYAMMEHILSRRYGKKAGDGEKERLPDPDLILVDGGKGQLNIAVKVAEALGINAELAALAKDRDEPTGPLDRFIKSKGERVFLPHVKDPVVLKEGSKPDLFLRRIRDEVHRFAISYHRKLRSKITSVLDGIPGVGDKRRRELLKRFGDLDGILSANIEELKTIPGITDELALRIKEEAGRVRGEEA
ncbi:MAG: excinuclease ABC subunit UvrC [Deltaproteobacteria bacterium]|nr:excinuclease ABC subunit UvrC [Deltaproteobacteria bacterium]